MNQTQYLLWIYATFAPMLSNDSFYARDYATHILNENRSPFIFMANCDELEGKLRLRHLQENIRCHIAQQWFDDNKKNMPWVKQGHEAMRYLQSPLNNLKNTPDKWPRWRLATALYLRDYVAETLDFNGVQKILNEFHEEEKRWKAEHNKNAQERLQPNYDY